MPSSLPGKRTKPDDAYYNCMMDQITPDGVNARAIGYAFARLASGDSRPVKTGYAAVLEFTGIDKRFYNNERLKKYYKWLFSLAICPDRRFVLIGDTGVVWGAPRRNLQYNRVVNFSDEAGRYASWLMKGVKQKGHILSFVVPKKELPPAESPTSTGYIVVNDDVRAKEGETVQVYWQPATETKVASVKQRESYVAPIDHHNVKDDKELAIFFASEPVSVRQNKVTSGFLQQSGVQRQPCLCTDPER